MRKRPSWLPSLWTGTLKNLKFHRSCSLCRGLFSLFSEFCLACHVSYCLICFYLLMWFGLMRVFAADHPGTSCLGGIVFVSHCASSLLSLLSSLFSLLSSLFSLLSSLFSLISPLFSRRSSLFPLLSSLFSRLSSSSC